MYNIKHSCQTVTGKCIYWVNLQAEFVCVTASVSDPEGFMNNVKFPLKT